MTPWPRSARSTLDLRPGGTSPLTEKHSRQPVPADLTGKLSVAIPRSRMRRCSTGAQLPQQPCGSSRGSSSFRSERGKLGSPSCSWRSYRSRSNFINKGSGTTWPERRRVKRLLRRLVDAQTKVTFDKTGMRSGRRTGTGSFALYPWKEIWKVERVRIQEPLALACEALRPLLRPEERDAVLRRRECALTEHAR